MDDVMASAEQPYSRAANHDIAVERVIGFAEKFGQAHLTLASHAAFPLILTPDLLYRIWGHFVPEAPWTAVADILLSRLCHEVGHELYEMDTAVRSLLLKELKEGESFGQPRLNELADFLTSYVAHNLQSGDPDVRNLAQVQRWTALAYTRPSEAARELALTLSSLTRENNAELFRVASVVEALAEPLAEFGPLLVYAQGMAKMVHGDLKSATTQLGKAFGSKGQFLVAGVSISVPEQIFREPSLKSAPRREQESFPAVVICGPSRSGKSVLAHSLTRTLRARGIDHYTLWVFPMREGDWINEVDQAQVWRIQERKDPTSQWITRLSQDIINRQIPLIVDIGGQITSWQEAVLGHCTHAILLTPDESTLATWRELTVRHSLSVLAELRSTLTGNDQVQGIQPVLRGQIGGLERGSMARGPTFEALVDLLANLFAYDEADLRVRRLSQAPTELVIELDRISQELGLEGEQPHWLPEHLPALLNYVPANTPLSLFGRGPSWLYAALALHAYPAQFYQFDARQGWIAPPTLSLSATSSVSPLRVEYLDRNTHLQLNIHVTEAYLNFREAEKLMLPPLPPETGVILNGKLPLWLWTTLARMYHTALWIGIYYPVFEGAVVIASQDDNVPIGTLVPLEQKLQVAIEPHSAAAVASSSLASTPESNDQMGAIHKLLNEVFETDTLTAYCFDYFPTVYTRFSPQTSIPQKLRNLVDYCESHRQVDYLLAQVQKLYPSAYSQWEMRQAASQSPEIQSEIESQQITINEIGDLEPHTAKTTLTKWILEPVAYEEWVAAVRTLIELDIQDARDALIQALEHPDSGVRWNAVDPLAEIADTRSWNAIQQAFHRETGAALRGYLYEVLVTAPINRSFIISQHILQFIQAIEPTREERNAANEVVVSLHNKLAGTRALDEAYMETVSFGSLARATAIRPISDIDVLVVFRIDPRLEGPKTAYEILKLSLESIYPSQVVHRSVIGRTRQERRFSSFGGSILVDLPQGWLEVLPAVISRDNHRRTLVPDRFLRKWMPTNHEIHAEFTVQRNAGPGLIYSSLVKAVKKWQHFHCPPRRRYLSGFVLECLVATHLKTKAETLLASFESLLREIKQSYPTHRSLIRVPEIGVPVGFKETGLTQGNYRDFMNLIDKTLGLIEQSRKADSLDQELAIWQQIFGPEFPHKLS